MTLITFEDGKPLMKEDGKIGTEQACCCEQCCPVGDTLYASNATVSVTQDITGCDEDAVSIEALNLPMISCGVFEGPGTLDGSAIVYKVIYNGNRTWQAFIDDVPDVFVQAIPISGKGGDEIVALPCDEETFDPEDPLYRVSDVTITVTGACPSCSCCFSQWFGRGSEAQRDRVRAHIEECEGGVFFEPEELEDEGNCVDHGEGSYGPGFGQANDEIREDGLIFNAARTLIVGVYGVHCDFIAQYSGQNLIDCNERCPCALPEEYDNSPCLSCPDDKQFVEYGITARSSFTPAEDCESITDPNPLP